MSQTSHDAAGGGGHYSHHRSFSNSRRTNHIIERSSPSMLCLVRTAEPRPYTPLPPDVVSKVTQPTDYSLRPSAYVAHQALIDFYKVCDGYFGINAESSNIKQLTTISGKIATTPSTTAASVQQQQTSLSSSAVQIPSAASVAGPGVTPSVTSGNMPSQSVSDGSGGMAEQLNDYRIAQLRRNAQHVDTSVFSRVCHFYKTPEGCHRGSHCAYLHLDRNGKPVSK